MLEDIAYWSGPAVAFLALLAAFIIVSAATANGSRRADKISSTDPLPPDVVLEVATARVRQEVLNTVRWWAGFLVAVVAVFQGANFTSIPTRGEVANEVLANDVRDSVRHDAAKVVTAALAQPIGIADEDTLPDSVTDTVDLGPRDTREFQFEVSDVATLYEPAIFTSGLEAR